MGYDVNAPKTIIVQNGGSGNSEQDPFWTIDKPNYITSTQVDTKIASAIAGQFNIAQMNAIAESVLQNAEISGNVATDEDLTAMQTTITTMLNDYKALQQTKDTAQDTALTNQIQLWTANFTDVTQAIAALQAWDDMHQNTDDIRWQADAKALSDLRIELKQFVVDTYAGTTPLYDYNQTTTILQAGGLINLAQQGTYSIPANGAIQAQVGGLLGAGLQVQINGTTVWTAPINLLTNLSSPELKVNAGDTISYTGTVGIGQTIVVNYFPNKGITL